LKVPAVDAVEGMEAEDELKPEAGTVEEELDADTTCGPVSVPGADD
jgi:hypothetical protein